MRCDFLIPYSCYSSPVQVTLHNVVVVVAAHVTVILVY